MNPWLVSNIQDFAYLNCPECLFKSKEEVSFQDHALKNHPKSFAFFNNTTDVILTEQDVAIQNIIITETHDTMDSFHNSLNDGKSELVKLETVGDNKDQNIEFYVKVLDENTQPMPASILHQDHPRSGAKIRMGEFQGSRKKTQQSVQALIDVLDELSDDRYKCIVCDDHFRTAAEMKEHCHDKHFDADGKITCPHCPYRYPLIRKLNDHIRQKHVEKPKKPCPLCGKLFISSALSRHKSVVHADKSVKKFKCDLCDFTTYHQRYIYDHKKNKHNLAPTRDNTGKLNKIF